jgi:hypothetical protein
VPAKIPILDPESESYGTQRVISRSTAFVTVPIVAVCIIAANLIWEAVRINISPTLATQWPYRFTIFNMAITGALLGVTATLLFTRMQWARALRPAVGFSIKCDQTSYDMDSKWEFWAFNAGPGGAVTREYRYAVRLIDDYKAYRSDAWLTLEAVSKLLVDRNFVEGKDFGLTWNAEGAPMPAVPHYGDGYKLAWFTTDALTRLLQFDIRIRVVDSLGDSHERVFPIIDRLPPIAKRLIDAARINRNP